MTIIVVDKAATGPPASAPTTTSSAARGILVVPDYRLYLEVSYPDFLDDSAQAVAWTAKHIARYGGDPSNLFVMGHSADAYNAAMLALDARASLAAPLRSLAPTLGASDQFVRSKSALIQVQPM